MKEFELTKEQEIGLGDFFERQHVKQSHEHRLLFDCCDTMLSLPKESMGNFGYLWLVLCEKISLFDYESLVQGNGFLGYFDSIVIQERTSVESEIFNDGFISMLRGLLNTRWYSEYDAVQNKITINGKDINNINGNLFNPHLDDCFISIKKVWLHSYLTLFIKNSLDHISVSGHRAGTEVKNISIEIENHLIQITDEPIIEFLNEQDRIRRKKEFKEIKEDILAKKLNFRFKTLLGFMGIIEFVNKHNKNYEFSFGFNNKGYFSLEIKF